MIAVGGCPDDVSTGTYVTSYCLAVEKLKGTTGQLEASIYRSRPRSSPLIALCGDVETAKDWSWSFLIKPSEWRRAHARCGDIW